jgi:hypothetical protein
MFGFAYGQQANVRALKCPNLDPRPCPRQDPMCQTEHCQSVVFTLFNGDLQCPALNSYARERSAPRRVERWLASCSSQRCKLRLLTVVRLNRCRRFVFSRKKTCASLR